MLRYELGMYLQELTLTKVEVIKIIEDKIQPMENPLQDFKSQIPDFQVHLNSVKAQLVDKLAKLQSLHEKCSLSQYTWILSVPM